MSPGTSTTPTTPRDSFAAFESALRQNLAALGNGWLSLFAPHSPRLALAINCVFLPLALYGFTRRLFARKFDAVYLGGYLALLLIWPFPHVIGRLAYGALPIVALHAVIGASHLTERFPGPGKCCTALLVVSVALGNGYSLYELSARYYSPDLPQSLHSWRASQACSRSVRSLCHSVKVLVATSTMGVVGADVSVV